MNEHITPWKPLEDGEIIDFGYQEFLCTPSTLSKLQAGGMTHVNDTRVVLIQVDWLPRVNAVVVKWQSAEGDNLSTEWARYWAKKKETAA